MHFRRLAAMLMGAWLAGSVLVMLFTSRNLETVSEVIDRPAKEAIDTSIKLQSSDWRLMLNYHASEVNRWITSNWEIAELCLGVAVFLAVFFSPGGKHSVLLLCVMMIAITVFLHWFMTPQIERIGRSVQFVGPGVVSVARDRLRSLETGYWTGLMVKLILGLLTALLLLGRGRRRHRESDVD